MKQQRIKEPPRFFALFNILPFLLLYYFNILKIQYVRKLYFLDKTTLSVTSAITEKINTLPIGYKKYAPTPQVKEALKNVEETWKDIFIKNSGHTILDYAKKFTQVTKKPLFIKDDTTGTLTYINGKKIIKIPILTREKDQLSPSIGATISRNRFFHFITVRSKNTPQPEQSSKEIASDAKDRISYFAHEVVHAIQFLYSELKTPMYFIANMTKPFLRSANNMIQAWDHIYLEFIKQLEGGTGKLNLDTLDTIITKNIQKLNTKEKEYLKIEALEELQAYELISRYPEKFAINDFDQFINENITENMKNLVEYLNKKLGTPTTKKGNPK